MKRVLLLKCITPVDGFTVGKSYKCISSYGKYVQMIDDMGDTVVLFDVYFDKIGKKRGDV